ncbi:MAG: FixH family protein [Rhodomicrobiaceae bacterium]
MTAAAMRQFTGRHVLFILIGFFGLMLVANGIFVYFALSTYQGLDNPNAYERGVNYNQRIETAEKQAALGWSHQLVTGDAGKLEVTLRDRTGQPVTGLIVSGEIRRAVGEAAGLPLKLESAGDGSYRASVAEAEPGNWIVRLDAARLQGNGMETVYRMKERVWLKPNS